MTDINRPTAFGDRLIAACKARGTTLNEIGGYLGYSRGRIYQIARTERPSIAVVEKLARELGIDRSELDPDLTPKK